MAAVSSIRLLVARGSPPEISRTLPLKGSISTAAQPAGPGFGSAPPSV
jgi:hypothetical protein